MPWANVKALKKFITKSYFKNEIDIKIPGKNPQVVFQYDSVMMRNEAMQIKTSMYVPSKTRTKGLCEEKKNQENIMALLT